MPDLAALVTPPLLLDSTGAPANGDIYARLTNNVTIGAGIATPTQVQGKVINGQFKSLSGAAFYIPVTPEGVGVELFVELIEGRPYGYGSSRDRHSIRRTVSVPDVATVTWDALIDLIAVDAGPEVVIPDWVATTQAASDAAVAAAVTATGAKVDAEAAAASVAPGVAGGTATLDGSAKVPETQIPDRLSAATLSASLALKLDVNAAPIVEHPSPSYELVRLPMPTIHRLGGGAFLTILDTEALRPATGVTYYASATGVDTNTGLSAASPLTAGGAMNKSDVGTIIYAPGEYYRTDFTPTLTRSINHLASGPGVKLTGFNSPSSTAWTLVSGSIYSTSRSGTVAVTDVATDNRTSWGDYVTYEKKVDLASITAAGQWAIVGSTVYVWALGNANLSDATVGRWRIRLGVTASTGIRATGTSVQYVRGIDFEGNVGGGLIVNQDALIVAEDCTIRHSTVDGVIAAGGKGIIMRRCTISSNGADGASYTSNSTYIPEFIEIDVRSHHNGLVTPAQNNATTSHSTVRGIRVGGDYDVSGGPVVADVNSARTWNLGCRAGSSTAAEAQNESWRVDATGYEGDAATMWLDECVAEGAVYAFSASGAGRLYVHGSRIVNCDNPTEVAAAGVVEFYTP